MEVTLMSILRSKEWDDNRLLQLKRELLEYKRQGKLFFTENLLHLPENQPFQLYYYQIPNHATEVNAFPVPINQFKHFHTLTHSHLHSYKYLKEFYESYYDDAFDQHAFNEYDLRPYIGDQYVWYYKHIG
ncbi:hypothetical protein IMZ31_20325 (plasmid) [Pontibacillus sp. ALD_SL1]|uniref:hypothetical protein n=1 Tax=Pontibacillus sp. ALD_SL1 TaxID=2777185 RepID=UPI001A95864B|nr:hypothetical protein [Pontibacillus sp. ALD_SL1]QST02897.1 hypothetical protein IMZ31_20325 [Pontibacillus sp. ALD_SL1]